MKDSEIKDLKVFEHFLAVLGKLQNEVPKEQHVSILLNMFETTMGWVDLNLTEQDKRALITAMYAEVITYANSLPDVLIESPTGERYPHLIYKDMCVHRTALNKPCVFCDSKVPF